MTSPRNFSPFTWLIIINLMADKKPSVAKNFAIGGLAGMISTCCV